MAARSAEAAAASDVDRHWTQDEMALLLQAWTETVSTRIAHAPETLHEFHTRQYKVFVMRAVLTHTVRAHPLAGSARGEEGAAHERIRALRGL